MLFEIRAVMVVFSAFIGSIIVITVGWYNISLLDNDSRGMDVSLEALTCVVKKKFQSLFLMMFGSVRMGKIAKMA
ncbi:hypothetical protein CEXT_19091 [Caerostris extrusa]|uniref:Uncharacterized protein n=1 Tax=Caerostris extrusa TaxID=172846 RepID=A0AAV4P6U4_CAEEX|nr:hypothetical protein CEXT_19091 [Caerostris extrusa]